MPHTVSKDKIRHPDRIIWAIAGPAILSNTSTSLVGLVDTWAIGHLPEAAMLAGLAAAAYVVSLIFWSFGFLRMGTTGLIAQAYGAKAMQRLVRILFRSLVLGIVIGLMVVAVKGPLATGALSLLGVAGRTESAAQIYLDIRLWGAPLVLMRFAVIGMLIALQRTVIALYLELFLNLLNAALTILLVVGLDMGVAGAATGSLIAETLAGLAAISVALFMFRPRLAVRVMAQRAFWRLASFGALLAINFYIFIRTVALIGAFGLFTAISAHFGPLTLAANHVLLTFVTLISLGLDAMAYAAEALVGEAVGAKSRTNIRYWSKRTGLWALVMSVGYALAFFVFGRDLIAVFTDIPAVREAAEPVLIWMQLLPLFAVWSYQFDGIFIGATRGRDMMATMVIALLVFAGLLVLLTPDYGNNGLWVAFLGFFAARGIGLAARYPALEKSV